MSSDQVSENKLSPVEGHKSESRYLRGTLAEEFADASLDHLSDVNKSLIKFHGSYQQEDRDARKTRGKAGVVKQEVRLPAGSAITYPSRCWSRSSPGGEPGQEAQRPSSAAAPWGC